MKTFSEYLIDTKKKSYNAILEMQNYALSMAYNNANIVLEEYGIFKGCLQLSDFTANKIRKQLNKSNSSVTNVEISYVSFAQSRPNVLLERFFDTITIVCEITKNVHNLDGSYSFSSKFDTKECYIHNIIINLYIPVNDDYDDLESVLSHELTHAYNDYITKNGKIISSFRKHFKKLNYSSLYTYSNDTEGLIKNAIYFVDSYEKNAFFAQIRTDINKLKERNDIKDPISLYNAVQEIDVYQAYKMFKEMVSGLHDMSDEQKDEVVKTYNTYFNKSYNINEVVNKLTKLYDKVCKNLDRMVAKACAEEIAEVMEIDKGMNCKKTLNLLESFKQ